ncbi:hypothetical protein JOF48_003527 [Arthrobacter stackebrandtii]|uniref:Uncharacterized protein n=1 Tax=Arthrobacter stackebrandtii TaxID=272161 RepID=A0ABS4Z128_9MICC|nr:hypothetical protein [Arthrobacter stackebrandtii]MBP2414728.1 hypothetical protein [Arthrobacter stackebrandtii]PYH01812.1 hypothetical protein CVV67_05010 [Arthrobacter stackebrandtii]
MEPLLLHFLPYSRRGEGAGPGAGLENGRRKVSLPLTLETRPTPPQGGPVPAVQPVDVASAPLSVLGPADVRGLSDSQIVRRIPRSGDQSMEPNYLAGIELAHPDLPWMFTLGGVVNETLNPWIMLIVLPEAGGNPVGYLPNSPCPVLTLPDAGSVPRPDDAWAFAHVQVHGADSGGEAQGWAGDAQVHAPALRSRLLCPTRLVPETSYVAAVVPTYEVGRLAGLGLDSQAGANGDKWWTPAAGLQLPVYDSWTFRTGPSGDFEDLAGLLHPSDPAVMAQLGSRAVAIEPKGSMLPAHLMQGGFGGGAVPGAFAVPTAIIRIDRSGEPGSTDGVGPLAPDFAGPGGKAAGLHAMLKQLLDPVALAGDEKPLVGPPLYGQWPAQVRNIDGDLDNAGVLADVDKDPGSRQGWIEQLNADPFHRIAAGLGAAVVRRDQEELMRDAWEQLAGLERANRRIRWSALHMAVSATLHDRVMKADPGSQLRFLAPSLGRLRSGPGESFYGKVSASVVSSEVLTTAFTRQARAASLAVRRSAGAVHAGAPAVAAVVSDAVRILRDEPERFQPGRFTAAPMGDRILEDVLTEPRFAGRLTAVLGVDGPAYLDRVKSLPDFLGRLAAAAVTPDVVVPDAGGQGGGGGIGGGRVDGRGGIGGIGELRPNRGGGLGGVGGISLNRGGAAGGLRANRGGGIGGLRLPEGGPVFREELRRRGADGRVEGPVGGQAPMDVANLAARRRWSYQDTTELKNTAAVDVARLSKAQAKDLLDPRLMSERLQVAPARLDFGAVLAAATVDAPLRQKFQDAGAAATGLREAAAGLLGTTTLQGTWLDGAVKNNRLKAVTDAIAADWAQVTPVAAKVSFPAAQAWTAEASTQLAAAVEPVRAYAKMLAFAAEFNPALVRKRPDTAFTPAMAAPTFTKPVVERLKAIDEKWVLGGVDRLEPNSVCLLEVNWKFVESLLAGANHEMAREMLWRRYPTDLRGSCFRRFWDKNAEDIAGMDSWRGALGMHQPAAAGNKRADITLLVLKGDLLRRYPNTVINAVQGVEKPAGTFTPTDNVGEELFRGTLNPDVSYVGLDIAPETLRQVGPADNPTRWYIQLAEPHGEPRFGLDEVPGALPGSNQAPAGLEEADLLPADSWSWQGLNPPPANPARTLHLTPQQCVGENSILTAHSAVAAQRLYQKPFRLLMLGTDYI